MMDYGMLEKDLETEERSQWRHPKWRFPMSRYPKSFKSWILLLVLEHVAMWGSTISKKLPLCPTKTSQAFAGKIEMNKQAPMTFRRVAAVTFEKPQFNQSI